MPLVFLDDLTEMGVKTGHAKFLLLAVKDLRDDIKSSIKHNNQDQDENKKNCSLTCKTFKYPVTSEDGFVYEWAAIEHWLKNHSVSPLTNMVLGNKNLTSVHI